MEFELTTRKRIYDQIKKSPGIHFRELERRLQLVVGSLQYHLHYLENNNLIIASKDGEYIRYFVKDKSLNETERKIISFLRRSVCRHILLLLLSNTEINNKEISQTLGLSHTTITWHTNKLVESKIIERKKEGRISKFTIIDPSIVTQLFINYKESFLDAMVNSFIKMCEEDRISKLAIAGLPIVTQLLISCNGSFLDTMVVILSKCMNYLQT
jgi:DNA-binding transcriptional ArsR family regulator